MDSYACLGGVPGISTVTSTHPTTEPFATCVAALCRHVHDPEEALNHALHDLAVSCNNKDTLALHTPETILAYEALRHGYPDAQQFRHALIPAIHKRAIEICGHAMFEPPSH